MECIKKMVVRTIVLTVLCCFYTDIMSVSNFVSRVSAIKAARPEKTEVVSCGSCDTCDKDICQVVIEIESAIERCCEEILDTTCGPLHHIYQTDIPLTISKPGKYCIMEDLSASTTAITITASGVSLDCNKYAITLVADDAAAIVVDKTSQIAIFNGVIRAPEEKGYFGVVVERSSQITVFDMSFEEVVKGVYINFSSGIMLDSCDFVSNGTAIQCSNPDPRPTVDEEAFLQAECSECVIKNCTITDFVGRGVAAFNTTNILLQDLMVRGSGTEAQHIVVDTCAHAVITKVMSEGDGVNGIVLQACQGVVVADTTIYLFQENAQGISVQAGVVTFVDGTRSKIRKNRAYDTVIQNCMINGLVQTGIYLRGAQKVYINNCQVMADAIIGLFVDLVIDARVRGCTVNLEVGQSSALVTHSSQIILEDCTLSIQAPEVGSNAFEIASSAGITVKNCVLNLNTAEDVVQGGDGILLRGGVRSCLIQDCSVLNFPEAGIVVLDVPRVGPCYDIIIDHCDIHKAYQDGISFEGVSASTIKNCDLAFAAGNGIDLVECNDVAIINNIVQNNGEIGIRLDATTTNCMVRDNTIFGNLQRGVDNAGMSNPCYHNFAYNNGAGAADNYVGVPFVVSPAPGIGAIENISQ